MVTLPDEDLDLMPALIRAEWPLVQARLESLGLTGEFRYLGAGASAVVLLGPEGDAYKVARSEFAIEMLSAEYEYLTSMQESAVGASLPRPLGFQNGVLVREGIPGRAGGWGTRGLRELYDRIVAESRAREWTAPEFKEDSFIITDDGRIVMVDVGYANPIGNRHARKVEDRLDAGELFTEREARDAAWGLRMDAADGLVSPARARALQARLEALVGRSLD
jgi:hypothetical protein